MRYYFLVFIIVMTMVSGCGDINFPQVEKKIRTAGQGAPIVVAAADKATDAVEELTKKTIVSVDTAEKGIEVSSTAKKISQAGGQLLAVADSIAPAKAKPYISLAEGVLGLVSIIAGAAGAFFKIRKDKAENATKTLIKVVDGETDIGKKITAAAKKDGTSKEVEATYLALAKTGDVGSK